MASAGTVTLNGAILNLSIGNITDGTPTQAYSFIDMTGANTIVGSFTGHAFGTSPSRAATTFILSNAIDFEGGNSTGGNDAGLITQVSNNYFVSATWLGDAPNTPVTDPVLTDGQTATFGVNAFATIQDALAAAAAASSSVTAIIVNPGAYGDTTVPAGTATNQAPTIVLQGTAISIASLTDTLTPNASITFNAGTTLNIGGDNLSSTYDGTILGGGAFIKSGSGNLTLNQNNIPTGSVEAGWGASCNWETAAATSAPSATSVITVDPTATLLFDEPGATTTLEQDRRYRNRRGSGGVQTGHGQVR